MVFCTIIAVGLLFMAVDLLRNIFNKAQPTSQENTSAVQASNINIFRTEYFQFQASPSWREIANESKPGHYVYRSYRGNLLEQDVVIEVNQQATKSLAQQQTTRVVPVRVEQDGTLVSEGGVSDSCTKEHPPAPTAAPKNVTINSVSFLCNPNANMYEVVAGVVNGTTRIEATRQSGGKGAYYITFRSYKFTPDNNDFIQMIDSFQAL